MTSISDCLIKCLLCLAVVMPACQHHNGKLHGQHVRGGLLPWGSGSAQ